MSIAVKNNKKKKELNIYNRVDIRHKVNNKPCYELVFLLRSDMSSEDAIAMFEKIKAKIFSLQGYTQDVSYWGLRSLKYKIKRMKKAHFYCLHFTGSSGIYEDLGRFLRNNASVLRFINIRIHSLPTEKSPILVNLEKDVSDGIVVYDEKYIVNLN
ncbi:MAG: 30S ribosomal protein S6 [Alphaproteobacteria bacterium]|nr:30S ribosomal protein S6 [Rickettsiales bacterium]